ncbi:MULTISPECIES: class A beta-lactamase [unclassified Rathayibacter]|uniref:class A beta-lactamase n=1 Tax=unclassified Rathayibacter TaxID=2609250 RepID=UPI000F4BE746|nr:MULTISPECIES: class A beta-lactamase [unclassified Rathayibacter]ROP48149.1 beta-lactamase class A [Rathayibacter sp. PhB186]ROS48665.1 beta-lactamase class A [Rathayibacter sp. PhB185]
MSRHRPGSPTRSLPVLAAGLALVLSGCAAPSGPATSSPPTALPSISAASSPEPAPVDVSAELAALEAEFDARIGVSAVDTGSGRQVLHRQDERFGYASSIKALAAAEFLRSVPVGERDEVVTWTAADVEAAGYSPVTSESIDGGLPLAQLAEAAVRRSDNTALNLVLDRLGGPAALDRALEQLGDTTTDVVDEEPALNTIAPGGTANTTTPAAFTADLTAVALGEALPSADRALLLDWMSGNATGDALIRAGAPEGWTVADKSGGAGGLRNDIAVVTPPGRDPIVLSVLTSRNDPEADYDDALVARAAAVVLAALQ